MINSIIESTYPLSFRKKDAQTLGRHLKLRNSVELVGVKRVGISNFLRFFLYHKDIISTYINHNEKHLFVPVDLNDLIERELQPFWILLFKRLLDAVDQSELSVQTQKKISSLFLASIQSQDLFLTLEYLREAVQLILAENIYPTFFLLRFDRLDQAITKEFFNNLQGFIENSAHRISFVFTSFRPLDQIKPDVFTRPELASFSHIMDLHPASITDMRVIYESMKDKFDLKMSKSMENAVLKISGGHVQYLYLILVILHEKISSTADLPEGDIIQLVVSDERIRLQSEEIWESLSKDEKDILVQVVSEKKNTQKPSYLQRTGILDENNTVFSPLFAQYLSQMSKSNDESVEFSRKEHRLYTLLFEHKDQICEREKIIHEVWPEYEEVGVSDWTIDRLVARLRQKLILQKSQYSVVTVKTRGYKLV